MIITNAKLNWTAVKTTNALSGKYQTDFFLENDAAIALTEKIDAAWNEYKGSTKKAQSLSYSYETDEDGNETGRIKFKASQSPNSRDGKYTFEVRVYDAKANLIPKQQIPNIGNGTVANLDISIYPYTFQNNKGIKLNLNGIQIIKLEEFSNGPDFSSQDEGYVSENSFVAAQNPNL